MTAEEIIGTLNTTASRIKMIVVGLSDEQLQQRGANGHWSIKEITGHLLDDAVHYGEHFRRIVADNNPLLPGYDQDAANVEGNYNQRPIGPVISEFDRLDKQIVALLSGLDAAGWQRPGVHEERGPTTLEAIVVHYTRHEQEHFAEIESRIAEVKQARAA